MDTATSVSTPSSISSRKLERCRPMKPLRWKQSSIGTIRILHRISSYSPNSRNASEPLPINLGLLAKGSAHRLRVLTVGLMRARRLDRRAGAEQPEVAAAAFHPVRPGREALSTDPLGHADDRLPVFLKPLLRLVD